MTQLADILSAETRAPEQAPQAPAPSRSTSPAVRRLGLGLLIVMVATFSAYLTSAGQRPMYGAEAKILVDTGGSDAESIDPVLATQQVIIRSDGVLAPVAAQFGMKLRDLRKTIVVSAIGESEILRVSAVDAERSKARRMVQAVADNYIRTVAEAPLVAADETTAFLEERSKQLAAELEDVTKREEALEAARLSSAAAGGGAPPAPSEAERRLEVQAASLARRLGSVQDRITSHELDLAGGTNVRLVSPARVLDDPVRPKPVQTALGGFVVGLLLAAGAVTLLSLRK